MANITALKAYLKNQHTVHAEARKAQTITIASPRDVCGIGWEDIDLETAHVIHAGRQWYFLADGMAE